MTKEELNQIAEEEDAQVENLGLLEFAHDVIVEINEEMERQIKESGADK